MRAAEPRWAARALVGLGVLSALLYALVAFGLRLSNAERDVAAFLGVFGLLLSLYGAAAFLVRRLGDRGSTTAIVVVFAILFRILLLFAGLPAERSLHRKAAALGYDLTGRSGYAAFLIYDNDVWRYLWEGHVGAAGVSPFVYAPAEIARRAEAGEEPFADLLADELWWDVLDNVSFQGHTSVYPPAAQWLFRLAHGLVPGSVLVWKLLVVVADLGTCWALVLLLGALGRPSREVLLWAWNPLVLKELAGSGHLDAWMIWPLVLAVYWLATRAGVRAHLALGLSALVKLGSAALAPLFLTHSRRRSWPALAAVVGLGLLPLVGELRQATHGLAAFGSDWVFNSGPWVVVRYVAGRVGAAAPEIWAHGVAKAGIALATLALARWSSGSRRSIVRATFCTLALVVLFNPAVMPWYLLWALPFAVALGFDAWLVLTGSSFLAYLYYVDGVEHAAWLWLEYGLFAGAVAWEILRRRYRVKSVRPV
jgi:hypothetical protein